MVACNQEFSNTLGYSPGGLAGNSMLQQFIMPFYNKVVRRYEFTFCYLIVFIFICLFIFVHSDIEFFVSRNIHVTYRYLALRHASGGVVYALGIFQNIL